MGKVWMPGGGGSADLDVVTAGAGDIRKGKVTVDRDGEPLAGTMPENPSPTAALNCGQSKAIPAGYSPGGTVTANSLASQTGGATATDAYVRSGYTYWKDGVKRIGTMTVSSVVSFSVAAYSTTQIMCSWKNPAKGPYSGFAVCAKMGGYPNNEWDGRVYTGGGTNSALNANNSALVNGLGAGSTYYFRIWTYINTNLGAFLSSYLQASGMTTRNGRQAFTASGTFTVPANVRSIDIHCTGGGGSTRMLYESGLSRWAGGGGAGGGYTAYKKNIAVSPGTIITCVVGSGAPSLTASPGGTSHAEINNSIVVSASGGVGCPAWTGSGRAGGSGGGGGSYEAGSNYVGSPGGSNGSNGVSGGMSGGKGQGTSTREFGEENTSLYGGGGGGGNSHDTHGIAPGGAGGGGAGAAGPINPVNGSFGTGGGGGGGLWRGSQTKNSIGGSGNVIIRW